MLVLPFPNKKKKNLLRRNRWNDDKDASEGSCIFKIN